MLVHNNAKEYHKDILTRQANALISQKKKKENNLQTVNNRKRQPIGGLILTSNYETVFSQHSLFRRAIEAKWRNFLGVQIGIVACRATRTIGMQGNELRENRVHSSSIMERAFDGLAIEGRHTCRLFRELELCLWGNVETCSQPTDHRNGQMKKTNVGYATRKMIYQRNFLMQTMV